MKALVTGGAGFAGSHLVEYLLSRGQDVVALVHREETLANLAHVLSQVHIERTDIRDSERILQILRDTRPQRVYHLAAFSSPMESFRNPRLTYEVNFMGTFNLLSAWHRLGMDCRFLLVSSAEVYGFPTNLNEPLRETATIRPANPYAVSKAAAELVAFQFFQSEGLPIIRVRPFNHTGPRQPAAFVCSGLARQVAEVDAGLRPPVVTVGNLKVRRDFCDVRDIVRGYHLLLENGEPGEVYQLCSGRPISIKTVLQALINSASRPIRTEIDESKVRSHESTLLWGDSSKAERAVGWKPEYKLKTTLHDLKIYWENVLHSGLSTIPARPGLES